MFTVKIEQDNMVRMWESEFFSVHLKGSEIYETVQDLLGSIDKTASEVCEVYQTDATYKDMECTIVNSEEEVLYSERKWVNPNGEMKAVIVEPNDDEYSLQTSYVVLTHDDHVYVTNDQGKTVYTI